MLIRCDVSTTACASRAFVKERGGDTASSATSRPLGDTVGIVTSLCSAASMRLRNADIIPNMRGCEVGAARNDEGEGAALDW
eukprot:916090-Pyramimonas_sp.AAC.1